MRKISIIISLFFAIIITGYLLLRYSVLNTDLFDADNSKAKNVLDLRPRLVAKLQQLVYDGSDGLYRLDVDSFDIDISDRTIDFTDAVLRYDTARLNFLDSLKIAPDDLYNVHFNTLHIDGIGIDDVLNNNEINIKGIILDHPKMQVFSIDRPYNAVKRRQQDSLSLYKKLMGNLKRISVEKIIIKDGTFKNSYNQRDNGPAYFKGISVEMNDLLVDKTTEFDGSRFLFAKKLKISTKNYSFKTSDSLYNISCGNIVYRSTSKRLVFYNVKAKPRVSESIFNTIHKYQNERYDVDLQRITFYDINWWNFINYKKLTAREVNIPGGKINIYLDRRLPVPPTPVIDNFPQQLFMKMTLPVDIQKLVVKKINIEYKEFNPKTDKTGTVYIDSVNVDIANVSNTRVTGNYRYIKVTADALIMHQHPVKLNLVFDKQKTNEGYFTADLSVDAMEDREVLNSIAEPLGGFSIKKGTLQKGEAKIVGNNSSANAEVLFLYNNLSIIPLKKDKASPGKLKKKTLTGIFANLFVIKHSNPSGNDKPRAATVQYERLPHASFFNLIWKTILAGILETVGIPEKFAEQ